MSILEKLRVVAEQNKKMPEGIHEAVIDAFEIHDYDDGSGRARIDVAWKFKRGYIKNPYWISDDESRNRRAGQLTAMLFPISDRLAPDAIIGEKFKVRVKHFNGMELVDPVQHIESEAAAELAAQLGLASK